MSQSSPQSPSQSPAIIELRDSAEARTYLLQGLWLSRLAPPTAESLGTSLQLAAELLAVGDPLPPPGFVTDVGRVIVAASHDLDDHPGTIAADALPGDVVQRYEDYVLGKLYADGGFERGATAICRYADRDRPRGIAWLVGRFARRAGVGGVLISPNVVRNLQNSPREALLAEGAESLRTDGLLPLLEQFYLELIERVRNLGDVLGAEDVFELERGTVLIEFGQRLALRQMLQMAARLEADLPLTPPRIVSRHRNVATHLLDEDTYPVGGFSSISNSGTIESLLHSQLAYMEPDADSRPDLFDIKFLRGELLYYARDENEFLRRRRTIVVLLSPDLIEARRKDATLPCQRIVLVLSLLLVLVRRLTAWLSDEALLIEILVTSPDEQALHEERELLSMALGDQLANGTVRIDRIAASQVTAHLEQSARSRLTTSLAVGHARHMAGDEAPADIGVQVGASPPVLSVAGETRSLEEDELSGWQSLMRGLMMALMQSGG